MKSIFQRNFKLINPFAKTLLKNQLFFHNTSTLDGTEISDINQSFINSRRNPISKVIKGKSNEKIEFNTQNLLFTKFNYEFTNRHIINHSKLRNHNEVTIKVIKTFPAIKNELDKLLLLENQEFLNILNELIYSFDEANILELNPHLTVTFKFVIMTAQLINPDIVKSFNLHQYFPDLNDIFKEDLVTLFKESTENILLYNVFYFCFKNTGQFSIYFEKLLSFFKEKPEVHNRLRNVLNTKFNVKKPIDQSEFSLDYEYLNKSDNNITTPNTVLLKDIIFKYEDKLSKVRQITDDINTKRTVEKVNYIIGYFKKIQNFDNEFFSKMNNFNDSMKIISSYFLENIKEILDKDIEIMFNEINTINNKIDEYLRKFTKLVNPIYPVNVDNLHDVFNPLFSGEFDIEKQFQTLLNNEVGIKFALNILKKYIDSQFSQGEIVSFNDLLRVQKILNNKYSYHTFLLKNCLIIYDYDHLLNIDLLKYDIIVPKNKSKLQTLNKYASKNTIMSPKKSNYSTVNRSFYLSSSKHFSSTNKTKEYIIYSDEKERERISQENFASYIDKVDNIDKGIEIKEEKVEEVKIEEKVEEKFDEKPIENINKINTKKVEKEDWDNIDFFSNLSLENKDISKEKPNKNKREKKFYENEKLEKRSTGVEEEQSVDESKRKIIRNGIDLTLAAIVYNLDWWNKKVLFYENIELRKKSIQIILSDSILKDEIPSICYSLIHFRYELNSKLNNSDLLLYDIFINPVKEEGKEKIDKESIDEFISNHPFKFPLGYYGYMSLLKTAGFKKSKTDLKKVIELMKYNKTKISEEFYNELINICIDNKFPITLHEIMSNFLQEGSLSRDVFIKYVLYLDSFKEYSQEVRELCLNIQDTLKFELDFSIIEPFIIKQISIGKRKDISETLKKFKTNLQKNLNLEKFKAMSEEEWSNYLEETIYHANYKTCLYMICSINKEQLKKEIEIIIKEIRNTRKKSKTPEWALINVLYCNLFNEAKPLPQYLNLLFDSKNINLEEIEFEELINLWDNGLIKNDIIAWKKLLQILENRNIIYEPKYMEKIINLYIKAKNPTELKIFLMSIDKERYRNYTFQERNSLKQTIKNLFDYPTFKEINEQLNSIYYQDRVRTSKTMKITDSNYRKSFVPKYEKENKEKI